MPLPGRSTRSQSIRAEEVRLPRKPLSGRLRGAGRRRRWAYIRENLPGAEETRIQRVSAWGNTRLLPPMETQCVVTGPFSVLGVAAQK